MAMDLAKQKIWHKAYEKALARTDKDTYQAMEAFIHNLNTMHSRAGAQVPFSSINFGTDTILLSFENTMLPFPQLAKISK